MSRKHKKTLIRIIISLVLFIAIKIIGFDGWVEYLAYLVP